MARFQLVVRPDGRALLTTTERLSAEALSHVAGVLNEWQSGDFPVAVVAECEVVQVLDVDIDLPAAEVPV
jgi:hypothetical protein